MTFRSMLKRQVQLNDKPVFVNEMLSAREFLRSAGADPSRYSLVSGNRDGTITLHNPNDLIKVREGQNFETQLTSRNGF